MNELTRNEFFGLLQNGLCRPTVVPGKRRHDWLPLSARHAQASRVVAPALEVRQTLHHSGDHFVRRCRTKIPPILVLPMEGYAEALVRPMRAVSFRPSTVHVPCVPFRFADLSRSLRVRHQTSEGQAAFALGTPSVLRQRYPANGANRVPAMIAGIELRCLSARKFQNRLRRDAASLHCPQKPNMQAVLRALA